MLPLSIFGRFLTALSHAKTQFQRLMPNGMRRSAGGIQRLLSPPGSSKCRCLCQRHRVVTWFSTTLEADGVPGNSATVAGM